MTVVEAHVLQSVPYSCLVRGDDGRPKTLQFGGVTRLQASSASWKRAARLKAESLLEKQGATVDPTKRTPHHAEYLAKLLVKKGVESEDADKVSRVAMRLTNKPFPADQNDEERAGGRAPLFVTESQFADIAAYVHANIADFLKEDPATKPTKDYAKHQEAICEVVSAKRGLVPLLGRFYAEIPQAQVDSALILPPAFTTHAQAPEDDFTVVVNDLPRDVNNPGAGNIVDASYASGTYYRYASVNLNTLRTNGLSEDDSRDTAILALRAVVESVPTGKINVAGQTAPADFVYLTVRDDAENLCNAFESPVYQKRRGLLEESVNKLDAFVARKESVLDNASDFHAHYSLVGAEPSHLGQALGREALYAAVRAAL